MVPLTLSLFALDKPLRRIGQSRRHGRHRGRTLLRSLFNLSRASGRELLAMSLLAMSLLATRVASTVAA
jgi:hypothetical protein